MAQAKADAAKPRTSSQGETEVNAFLKSSHTGRPVRWHRQTVKDSKGNGNRSPMVADAGAYRPGALMAVATKAAKTAARRYPQADLDDLTMELVEAALGKAPSAERLPKVGEIGTDPRIEHPLERDRAWLVGVARHHLADGARSEAAEVDSLDARLTNLGDLPSVSSLLEQADAQAHTDPNLVNPDEHPINEDVWRILDRFPTKDAGRAALSNVIGSAATRAQLAKQAGLGDPKDWHKSVKRGRAQLATLGAGINHWTAKDWVTAEAMAALVEALSSEIPKFRIDQILTQPPSTPYRAPNHDRPWRTAPDVEAPTIVTAKGKGNE